MSLQHKYVDGCAEKCGSCNYCCLSVCGVCHLFEGALTTHCSGETVSMELSDYIYKGKINYRGCFWLNECSEHSPVFYQHLYAKT